MGRGDRTEIGTYIERSVNHELSGNVIDLCPVGALNNKPYRFSARAWEMVAKPLVSPHDCVGSNLYAHVLRDRVRRVVPRDNDAINESWIADRDRFSCHGIDADDRLTTPLVKRGGSWEAVSWETALAAAVSALRECTADEASALGVLASPSVSVEEYYLLRRLADALGTRNIDHRLRQRDFDDQVNDAPWPWLGCSIADLETRDAIVLIGSDIRSEVPMLAHRIRKAVVNGGAQFAALNAQRYDYHFPVAASAEVAIHEWVASLAAIVAAAHKANAGSIPATIEPLIAEATVGKSHQAIADVLIGKERAHILLGHIALRHPAYSTIRLLATTLASLTGATFGLISEGGNSAGAALAGALPHRGPGGKPAEAVGLDAGAMLSSPRRAYLLYGLEPDGDTVDAKLTERALQSADKVIAFTAFASSSLKACADILLPIGTFAETPGTFVNAEGAWQSTDAAINAMGDARPGWRVLRVLGNLIDAVGFDYQSCADVLAELQELIGTVDPDNNYRGSFQPALTPAAPFDDSGQVGIYAVDALVRRSVPLQQTQLGGALEAETVREAESA